MTRLFCYLVLALLWGHGSGAQDAIEVSQDGANIDVEWGAPPLPQPRSAVKPAPAVLEKSPSRHDDLAADMGQNQTAARAKQFVTTYCFPDCSGCGYSSTVCQSVSYNYMKDFCATSEGAGLLPNAAPQTFAAAEQQSMASQSSDSLAGCYFMIADLLDICDTLCPHK